MAYTSSAALKKAIESRIPSALNIATEKIKSVIDGVLRQYYGEYNPFLYERTGQLMNSVKIEIIGTSCCVYIDSSGWNHILDEWSEEDILYDAMMVGSHGASPYATKHTAVWTESMIRLNDIPSLIKEALIAAGIPVI